MKKFYKEHSLAVNVISIVAILAIVISWFFIKEMYLLKFCSVLLIDGILLFLNAIGNHKFFERHDIFKIIALFLINLIVLSYLIPGGSYASGAALTVGEFEGLGLAHLFYGFSFAVQQYSIQIGFLVMLGVFYGVVSKTEGYKALVDRFAKFGKGKEVGVLLLVSAVIAFLASVLNNTLVLLAFVPFLVTVLRHMGFDKISAFATTFGAILVGVLGVTIGTDGLASFVTYVTYYGGSEITFATELAVRAGILVLAYVLFSFFNVMYLKKSLTKKKEIEKTEDDLFEVEEPKKKKTKIMTTVVVFSVLFILAILGFVYWNEVSIGQTGEPVLGLDIFETFHEWLMGLTIGGDEGIQIFSRFFGQYVPNTNPPSEIFSELGSWYLFTYSIFLGLAAAVIAFVSKMKLNDFLANAWDGIKKIVRPVLFLVLAYMVFVFIYWSPFVPTILSEIGALSSSFNPLVASLQALVATFFNSDFAFIGYSLNTYFGSFTGIEGNIMYLIYITVYGLVQFITPVSVFLIFGLSYMDIPYKKWLKYVWKFFLSLLACLLIIFVLLTYL